MDRFGLIRQSSCTKLPNRKLRYAKPVLTSKLPLVGSPIMKSAIEPPNGGAVFPVPPVIQFVPKVKLPAELPGLRLLASYRRKSNPAFTVWRPATLVRLVNHW